MPHDDANTMDALAIAEHNQRLVAEFIAAVEECTGQVALDSHQLAEHTSRIESERALVDAGTHALNDVVKHAHEEVQRELDALKSRWEYSRHRAEQLVAHLSEELASLHTEVAQMDHAVTNLTAAIEPIARGLTTEFSTHERTISVTIQNFAAKVATDLLAPLTEIPRSTANHSAEWLAAVDHQASQFHDISQEQDRRVNDFGATVREHAGSVLTDIEHRSANLANTQAKAIQSATNGFVSHNDQGVDRLVSFGTDVAQLAEELTNGYEDFVEIVNKVQDLSEQASGALGEVTEALGAMSDSFEALRI